VSGKLIILGIKIDGLVYVVIYIYYMANNEMLKLGEFKSESEAANRYLFLINNLGEGLPCKNYKIEKNDPSFYIIYLIEENNLSYMSNIGRIALVDTIINTEYVRRELSERIDSGNYDYDMVNIFNINLRKVENYMDDKLREAYSDGGKRPNESFGELYRRFVYSNGREAQVKEALDLNTNYFVKGGCRTNRIPGNIVGGW